MIQHYRKKPVVIEAVQWLGMESLPEIQDWVGGQLTHGPNFDPLYIRTLEGVMRAEIGDWIIKGIHGEFYPVKDSIFRETYELVDESDLSTARLDQ